MMIDNFRFGSIVVNGVRYANDIKIIGDRVVPNWWRRSGHRVEISDVQDILSHQPDVVVLGCGEPGYMQVSGALRQRFEQHGIEVIEEKTAQAVSTFNRLFRADRDVAAGFHVGC